MVFEGLRTSFFGDFLHKKLVQNKTVELSKNLNSPKEKHCLSGLEDLKNRFKCIKTRDQTYMSILSLFLIDFWLILVSILRSKVHPKSMPKFDRFLEPCWGPVPGTASSEWTGFGGPGEG